jgi:hypothetical protein
MDLQVRSYDLLLSGIRLLGVYKQKWSVEVSDGQLSQGGDQIGAIVKRRQD